MRSITGLLAILIGPANATDDRTGSGAGFRAIAAVNDAADGSASERAPGNAAMNRSAAQPSHTAVRWEAYQARLPRVISTLAWATRLPSMPPCRL